MMRPMVRDPRAVEVVAVSHPKGCRSYVVVAPETKEAMVVDPLLDHVGDTLRILNEHGASLRWIVDTHSHGDHLSGAAALAAKAGGAVVMHPDAPSEVATVRPADGEVLPFGEHGVRVLHAPGNTRDAIVLETPGALFSGDTLLIGTIGLRDAPGADVDAWFDTLQRIFRDRPGPTVVHPGHDDMGRTMTTIAAQKTGNRWLRQDDREAFRTAWHADARPVRKDAGALLDANRQGLLQVPRNLEAASGFVAPARLTEEATRRAGRRAEPAPDAAAGVAPGVQWLMLVAGLATIVGTVFGVGIHEGFLLLPGAAGVALVAVALRAGSRARRRADAPELYYQGPVRKGLS
jgi:glyoxylase-like metal-dependent hydrolase (beta-lactamase superfamily II)